MAAAARLGDFTTHHSRPHAFPLTTLPTYPRSKNLCYSTHVPVHEGRASKAFDVGSGWTVRSIILSHAVVTTGGEIACLVGEESGRRQ